MDVADLENLDTCDYLHSVKYEHQDDLIVMQLNIRGLYSKISLLTDLLSSCADGRLPDVVLLSETWLTPASPPVTIPEYDLVHCCRPHNVVEEWEYWYLKILGIQSVIQSPPACWRMNVSLLRLS